MAITGVSAVVPGYGAVGAEFGELVPSEEIVAGVRPARGGDLPATFLRDKLGIASVATTHATARFARTAIDRGLDWAKADELPRPATNPDVLTMLTRAMEIALVRHEEVVGGPVDRAGAIAGHLHVASGADNAAAYGLPVCRRAVGCHKPGLPMEFMVSGCAGLFYALRHAGFLLQHTDARHDPDAYVLITAANDMLPLAHGRAKAPDERREELDDWLFPTIFGEAVGALVVGHATDRAGWAVVDMAWQTAADDWRVTFDHADTPRMVIRARGVGSTFRENVPDAARRGLRALGLTEFDELHRLCVHESNPNLVAAAAQELDVPAGLVHSVSAEVGTLAGVSAFSLLEEAFASHHPDGKDGVVAALIGETGHAVVVGHLALRHHA
ncbi:hypothetical protein LV79_003090 [Actinokineospora globicatena]|nr:hypothetical protein [Actinokineospora globicatena]